MQIRNATWRLLATIGACILWSLAFVFIKIGLQYMPPLQFAGLRFLLSGLVLLPVAWLYMRQHAQFSWRTITKQLPELFALGNLQIGIKYGCFYIAVALLPAALSALISGSSPLIVALLAHFATRNDHLTFRKLLALFLGLVGVAILTIARKEIGAVGEGALLGILLLLLTNFLSGVGDLWVRRVTKHFPGILIASLSLIFGGGALLIAGWAYEGISVLPSAPAFYFSLAMLCIISAGAFALWFWILQDPAVKVSDLHIWKFLIPLLGAISSWLILPDESPTHLAIVGMVFIVLSLIILFLRKNFWESLRTSIKHLSQQHLSSDD